MYDLECRKLVLIDFETLMKTDNATYLQSDLDQLDFAV